MVLTSKLYRVLSLLVLCVMCLSPSFVFANTRFNYNDIYEVVVAGDGDDNSTPGIYSISEQNSGQPKLLVAGEVLGANRAMKGIRAQSSLSNGTSFDSFAVVDGRLIFFNHNTKKDNPKSYIKIGDEKSAPVLDVLNGRKVNIPLITNSSDVSIFGGPLYTNGYPKRAQFFLVSIKAPSMLGSGVTFAVIAMGSGRSDTVELDGGSAYLLAYDYYDEVQLARFVRPESQPMVYAPTLLETTKSQISPMAEKSKPIKKWLVQIEQFLHFLKTGKIQGGTKSKVNTSSSAVIGVGVPHFDLFQKKPQITALPLEIIVKSSDQARGVGVYYDPYAQSFGLVDLPNLVSTQLMAVGDDKDKTFFMGRGALSELTFYNKDVMRDKNGKAIVVGQSVDAQEKNGMSIAYHNHFLFFDSSSKLVLATKQTQNERFQTLELPTLRSHVGPQNKLMLIANQVINLAEGKNVLVYFISSEGAKAKHQEIFSVTVELGAQPRLVNVERIYQGTSMSYKEMRLRTQILSDDLLFDNVSPVRGAGAYERTSAKEDQEEESEVESSGVAVKTVPYYRLLNFMTQSNHPFKGKTQRYLKPLIDRQLTPELFYRHYDHVGAIEMMSGFYLERKKHEGSLKDPIPRFISGRPLFFQKKHSAEGEITHISDSAVVNTLQTSSGTRLFNMPDVNIYLMPFTDKLVYDKGKEFDVKAFSIAVAGIPDVRSSQINLTEGFLSKVDIKQPYESLIFSKIIPGIKNSANEFHVILAFQHDPKVPDSKDVVLRFTGRLNVEKTNDGVSRVVAAYSLPTVLYKDKISPGEIKNHLRVDAYGTYYWVDDPSIPAESSRYSVRRLSALDDSEINKRALVGSLREIKELEESSFGQGGGRRRRGGRWEVMGQYSLKERFAGAANLLSSKDEKKDKKSEEELSKEQKAEQKRRKTAEEQTEKMLFDRFGSFLDSLATQKGEVANKIQVVLVESDLKEKFRNQVINKLANDRDGRFRLTNYNFEFYYADKSLDDVEVADEFFTIDSVEKDKSKLLFVEPEVLQAEIVARALNKEPESSGDFYSMFSDMGQGSSSDEANLLPHDEKESPGSLPIYVATGGRAKTLSGFKKVKSQSHPVPTLIIATPEEWRQIEENNEILEENGVFDNFNKNFDFLTSSWTVWPPNSEKAGDDMRALAKTVYNEEEMRVFPTLDDLLNQAALGGLKGEQKILIVPPELLPIINKLILLRWSTPEVASALPWSFSHRDLSLFRLNTKDLSQAQVVDNFMAIQGSAAGRHSLLYGDLESILRAGRPTNPVGRNFTLRDPIRADSGLIVQSNTDLLENNTGAQVLSDAELNELQALEEEIKSLKKEIEESRAERVELIKNKEELDREDYAEQMKTIESAIADNEESIQGFERRVTQLKNPQATLSMLSDGATQYPHLMWWIAAEGKTIQPKKAKGWNLKTGVQHKSGTLLIGTEDQLAQLESDMAFERRFFDLRSHFDIEYLQPPDDKIKFKLIEQLFDRPATAALGIQFQLANQSGRDPRSQLIHQFINSIDQMAHDKKIEKTTAFVKAFIVLKQSLSEDPDLRRHRVIDQKYMERLFTRVFPTQLNLKVLSVDDWLLKVADTDQAVRDLQSSGYTGSQDLKRRFFENILSQSRPTDPSRPIPNSQIIFGTTSTGKTFLLRTFFKMASLIEYNPNRPNNENADYIFISVGDLTHDEKNEPNKMVVDKMIENVYDLLSQPKGARAHIVIDDFHKATSTEVRQKVFRFIQGIFEAKNGMLTVRSKEGRRSREIPIQNLNIYMTLNPTSNQKIRRAYIDPNKKYRPAELLKQEVLAALSDDKFTPEESELARWSDVINMDHFPRSAKVPELSKRVREYSRSNTNMMLVDPQVIDALVTKFAQANARELLAPAAASLTAIPSTARPARLYTVTLRDDAKEMFEFELDGFETKSQVNLRELQIAVRKLTQVDPVVLEEPKSLMRFISFTLQNFRMQVFNGLALEAHMTDVLKLDQPGVANLLRSSFLIGSSTHILANPELPIAELNVRPDQLSFYVRSQQEEFFSQLINSKIEDYFPNGFGKPSDASNLSLERFRQGQSGTTQEPKSRSDVILEYITKVHSALERFLVLFLRLDSQQQLRELSQWTQVDFRQWFEKLSENNPDAALKEQIHQLLNLFMAFQIDLNSPDLKDFQDPNVPDLTIYEEVRLFNYIVDKAITTLPWASATKFIYDVTAISEDYELGTKTSYKEYIGTHSLSPFAITTPEFMQEIMDLGFQALPAAEPTQDNNARMQELDQEFHKSCEMLLKGKDK